MATKVISAPAVEPITLTEAKNWLKVIGTADDDLITMLIESTRQSMEDALNLKMITQTVKQTRDEWPVGSVEFELDAYPVQSVTSIAYKTTSDTTQILSADSYVLDNTTQPARIYLKDGYTWPTLQAESEAVTINFVAGYGDTAADVPSKLKTLILHAIAFAYENRMNPVQERVTYIDKLVYLHRNWTFE
jgi:uncharacterized phiE125 gp8 family phage protein